ncbi:MAG: tRNA (guanosine(37)-N1)-methyltransferase TrmD [Acidiferrobacterales bacterium]
MRIDVITLFPEMLSAISENGITGRAVRSGLIDLHSWNPRDFTCDRHRTVDDRPYGGGPGMVMLAKPLTHAIRAAREAQKSDVSVVYVSPQGKPIDHALIDSTSKRSGLILIAGRYEGVDERVLQSEVDEEWSVGDFVVSGGELPAMMIIDAITRQLPGALGDAESAVQDSFVDGLLDCPHFTRPENYQDSVVPAVLLSGDHEAIRRWRLKQSLGRTWLRRPDLLQKLTLTDEQMILLDEFKQEENSGK